MSPKKAKEGLGGIIICLNYANTLAIVTLDDATQLGWFLFVSCHPAKAGQGGIVLCCNYANILTIVTLDDATQLGWFLFVSCHPRGPRQVRAE